MGASKALRALSAESPAAVYPHFDFLAGLLGGKKQILKWNATLTLANLAAVDREGRLDQIIDTYLAPIAGHNMIDASNTIRGAAVIATVKPYLAPAIAGRILAVERAVYATPECRNMAIGHAITALEQFFTIVPDKHAVLAFVRRQADNPRSATRAKARRFLKRWHGRGSSASGTA